MTRLLAALAAGALLLVRQLLCGHHARTSRLLATHPADGRAILACHCSACDARWKEYG